MIVAPMHAQADWNSIGDDPPVRILHLNAGNLYGGIERVLAVLAKQRGLATGMSPSFGVCFPGQHRDELEASGAPVHDLGPVRLSRPWSVSRARRSFGRIIQDQRIDVVVSHGLWSHAVFGRCVRRSGASLVLWGHGPFDVGNWTDRLGAWTVPDLVLANSRFTADSLKIAFPGIPCEVVGLPTSPRTFANCADTRAELRRSLGSRDDAVVVAIVSRIEPLKGHTILLQALVKLAQNQRWECWIVGGPQRSEEKRYFRSLQMAASLAGLKDRVRFLGARSDVGDLLAAADVYCQPNTGPEAFGLSLIEALEASLPVVTSRLGGAPEFLDETCAVITPAGDVAAVAAALELLISDQDLRRTLGRSGPARARAVCDAGTRLAAIERALASARKAAIWV